MYKDYRSFNSVDMSLDMYLELIGDLKDIGVKSITFTGGGEPLMNPNFNEMAEEAYKLGFELGLITNGISLNDLSNFDVFKFIRISLDAATRETYRALKGNDDFDRVVENIRCMPLCYDVDVGISFVVCELNSHEVDKIQILAEELPVEYLQLKPIYGTNLPKIDAFNSTIITDRHKISNHLPCYIAGLVGVATADGKVWYCCQKRGVEDFCLGNLDQHSFAEIWQDRWAFHEKTRSCKTCRYQNYVEELYNPTKVVRHRWFL